MVTKRRHQARHQLDRATWLQHRMSLCDYVLKRHEDDPDLTINALADELEIPIRTWRRWLKEMEIGLGDGPRLVDLRPAAQQAADEVAAKRQCEQQEALRRAAELCEAPAA